MIFNFYDTITNNPKYLWGVYIILILLSFILVTRFFIFLKQNYTFTSHNSHLFSYLAFLPKKTKKVVYSKREKKFFPDFYEAFSIVFSPASWKYFQSLVIVIFGIILLGLAFNMISFLGLSMIIGIMILFIPLIYIKAQKIRQTLVEQFPLFLEGMSRSMQAGYSFENALKFVRTEVSEPLRSELYQLESLLNLQVPLAVALNGFSERLGHPEISFFSESAIIQIKTGGNLIELFQKIGHIINEKIKLERDIRSFTSQGKMSGILVAALWPLSLLLFWWISPEHVAVLFQTHLGQILLAASILLECIGFYFVWKIVSIKI